MDYFSVSAFIAWIILGALGVFFTQRLLSAYLAVCVLLAVVSWPSGVAHIREQRSFDERQQAVQADQQELSAECEKLAMLMFVQSDGGFTSRVGGLAHVRTHCPPDESPSKNSIFDHGNPRGTGPVTLSVGLGISLQEKRTRPV
jgi:hypothetical protein